MRKAEGAGGGGEEEVTSMSTTRAARAIHRFFFGPHGASAIACLVSAIIGLVRYPSP